jgi:hypothetical protein
MIKWELLAKLEIFHNEWVIFYGDTTGKLQWGLKPPAVGDIANTFGLNRPYMMGISLGLLGIAPKIW